LESHGDSGHGPRFFLGLILLFSLLGRELQAADAIIREVEVVGGRRIEKAAVLSRVKSKVGAILSEEVYQDDIKSIFGLGYFESVVVETEDVEGDAEGDGVKLSFVVKEKPVIAKINFEGQSELGEDDFKDLVLVKVFEVLDIHKLNLTVDKMIEKYEEKGFYLVDIHHDVQVDEAKNEAVVTFKIQENDKVQVKRINIIGAKVITAEELKKIMQTQEGGPLSFISGSGSYREAVFERDVQALGFYYGMQGYVRARFGRPEVTVSPDKKFVYITFWVDEGDKYYVGNVDFGGDLLFSKSELEEDLSLVKGEVFSTETLRRETLRYTDKYSDLGYAFANVVPQPRINDETKTVDVTFEVEKGDRVYVGTITVTGNTRTKDKVIRRELRLQEGELFSGSRKREGRENVLRLGFFDSVEFHQSTNKSDPKVVDIEIRVKERSTGQLVIGMGYASADIGFTAQAQLSQNNFLGNGQVASLSAQILTGRSFYEFSLGFTEPYVGYSNWSLGGDLYQQKRNVVTFSSVPTFEETKTGFDIKLGHPVLEFTNLFLTYRLENSYVPSGSIIDQNLIRPEQVNGIQSSAMASLTYDKRDDRFDPRNGWYWSVSSEYAGLGGVRKFLRSRATMKFFHPIFWDFVFRMNMTGANIIQTTSNPIPVNELFIQGGLFSLRGYDFLSIGPKGTISGDANNLSAGAIANNLANKEIVIGGRNEVLLNAEIEFPILKEAKVRGVLFFDAGNSFNNWRENGISLYANLGWGFRWFTPIGPLRFEFGYPIVNTGAPKFYFTIGPPF